MLSKLTWGIVIGGLALLSLPAAGQPLKIEQVLSSAKTRVEAEDSRVPLLEAHVRLLKSMSKRRFEFRPNLGLFSFTSPAILAATIGSGLTYQNSRVSPQTLLAAEHDLLLARMARERAKVRAQIDAARSFFSLVEKQEIEKARCDGAALRQRQQRQLGESLRAGSLNALEYASFRQVAIDSEWGCAEARTARKLASFHLASVLGQDEPAAALLGEQPELKLANRTQSLPAGGAFLELALKFREDVQWTDRETNASRKAAEPQALSLLKAVPGSIDYRYYSHSLNNRNPEFLLGGHTVHLQLPWSIPLTKSTEKEAERQLAAARLQVLESDAAVQRREIRQEINALLTEAEAARDRIELARRKRDVMRESQQLLAERVKAGLSADAALFAASLEAAEQESENSLEIAGHQWKAAMYSLYVACGIHQKPEVTTQLMSNPTVIATATAGGQE